MLSSIKQTLIDFSQKHTTGAAVMWTAGICIVLGIILSVFVLWIFGVFNTTIGGMPKSEYIKRTQQNEKIIQQSTADAAKYKKEAETYYQQAEAIRKMNDEKSTARTQQDKELDEKIKKSDEVAKQENEKINQEHQQDINNINSMPDEQRHGDICARIDALADSDPKYNEYRCSR